jgi:cysteinyl-tRNA synthetase
MVMNITDIDDKIIKKSIEIGEEFTTIARKYEEEFLSDMDNLNVE